MLAPLNSGFFSAGISIRDAKKINVNVEKSVAIKEAMSFLQWIDVKIFKGDHDQAFGHLYDLIKAKNAFNSCITADGRKEYKNEIDTALSDLSKLLDTPAQEIFKLKIDPDNGNMEFNLLPDFIGSSVTKITQFDSNYFLTASAKECWDKCKHCFSGTNKVKAMDALNKMTEPDNVPAEYARSFMDFVNLADIRYQEMFGIEIEDSQTSSACLSLSFDRGNVSTKDSTLLATPVYSDEVIALRAALWDCPVHLTHIGMASSNPVANILDDMNYRTHFSEQARPQAQIILDKMHTQGLSPAEYEELYKLTSSMTISEFIGKFPAAADALDDARATSNDIIDYLDKVFVGYKVTEEMDINVEREPEIVDLAGRIDTIFGKDRWATAEHRELVEKDIMVNALRDNRPLFPTHRLNLLKILLDNSQ